MSNYGIAKESVTSSFTSSSRSTTSSRKGMFDQGRYRGWWDRNPTAESSTHHPVAVGQGRDNATKGSPLIP
eukprot:6175287-Pleurochrysis_carterae.AAC.1